MSYRFPCGVEMDGKQPHRLDRYLPRCEACDEFLTRVVADLSGATNDELGQCLAAFECRSYGGGSSYACAKRDGISDELCCDPCKVRREVFRRTRGPFDFQSCMDCRENLRRHGTPCSKHYPKED